VGYIVRKKKSAV